MDGRTDTLVEMDKPVGFTVVAEGNDGSIYFMMNGKECQNCSQLVRGYPDGRQEAMYQNAVSREWQVDKYERLEVLKDGGVAVTDLTTGQFRQVNFPGVIITADELEYSTLGMLVPLSPDGRWAAYTKTFNYSGGLGPDGRPDYGRTVHIVRVK